MKKKKYLLGIIGILPLFFLLFILIVASSAAGGTENIENGYVKYQDIYDAVKLSIENEKNCQLQSNELCWYYMLTNQEPNETDLKAYARWIAINNPNYHELIDYYRNKKKFSDSLEEYSNEDLENFISEISSINNDTESEIIDNLGNSDISKALVEKAKSRKGAPYVWGAPQTLTNPNQWKFDCSGFVCWVHYQCGIKVSRMTTAELMNAGRSISRDKILPGDIIVYRNAQNTGGHVGMYVGNNKVIHAPHTGDVVKESSLSYFLNHKGARIRRLY